MRRLVFFLLVVAALSSASEAEVSSQVCKPGESFKRYCNFCLCSIDGTSFACTRKFCHPGTFNEDGSPVEPLAEEDGSEADDDVASDESREKREVEKPVICLPGKTFKKFCDTCLCSADGTEAHCLPKKCPPGEYNRNGQRKFEHFLPNFRRKREVDEEPRERCTPGTIVKDDCNYCYCNAEGRMIACTREVCPVGTSNVDGSLRSIQSNVPGTVRPQTPMVCEPNKVFQYQCNTCVCTPEGTIAGCTYMGCSTGMYNPDGSMLHGSNWLFDSLGRFRNAEPMVCEPKKEFKYYCNTCRCSADGKFAGCTRMACPPGVYNADGSKVDGSDRPPSFLGQVTNAETMVCEPNKEFKHYCNTCQCSADGKFAGCTRMACPPGVYNADGSKVDGSDRPPSFLGQVTNAETMVCEPNKEFKHYCNTCQCSADGKFAGCTRMACPPGVYNPDGSMVHGSDPPPSFLGQVTNPETMACEPNKEFKHYCNTCRCSADGRIAGCTKMACPPGVYNADGSMVNGPDRLSNNLERSGTLGAVVCVPNKAFKYYCNMCRCSADGRYATCTRRACPPGAYNADGSKAGGLSRRLNSLEKTMNPEPMDCEPNSTFPKYCNTCRCSADGKSATCTPMLCPPGMYNMDGSMNYTTGRFDTKVSEAPQTDRMICEPLTSFKKFCNTCRCAADGMNAACTRKACPPDMYNEDGSLFEGYNYLEPLLGRPRVIRMACEPNKAFKNYCNNCRCARDGRSAACTHAACPPGVFNEDGSRVDGLDLVAKSFGRPVKVNNILCEPDRPFKRYCNDCLCSRDGRTAACTYSECPSGVYNEDGSRVDGLDIVANSFGQPVHLENIMCEPNRLFKRYCNKCQCSREGKAAACTFMECPSGMFNEDGSRVDGLDLVADKFGQPVQVQNITCEPNRTFKRYCNNCHCSRAGKNAACTYMQCPPGIFNEDGSRVDGLDLVAESFGQPVKIMNITCEPNQTFKNYCNDCQCSRGGGTAACTALPCPPGTFNKDGSVSDGLELVAERFGQPVKVETMACPPTKTFKRFCNSCQCSRDGKTAACTYMKCPSDMFHVDGSRTDGSDLVAPQLGQVVQRNKMVCEPNKSFKKYCNSCHCSQDGQTATCTYMECPSGMFHENGSRTDGSDLVAHQPGQVVQENKMVCEPNKSFKKYCNSCHCSQDGQTATCTYMECPAGMFHENGSRTDGSDLVAHQPGQVIQENKMVCEPNKSFKKYCNSCHCSQDGQTATCTYMECPSGMFHEDGSRTDGSDHAPYSSGLPLKAVKMVCEPNEAFKKHCNSCRCARDGKSAACTSFDCRAHNEDGSQAAHRTEEGSSSHEN